MDRRSFLSLLAWLAGLLVSAPALAKDSGGSGGGSGGGGSGSGGSGGGGSDGGGSGSDSHGGGSDGGSNDSGSDDGGGEDSGSDDGGDDGSSGKDGEDDSGGEDDDGGDDDPSSSASGRRAHEKALHAVRKGRVLSYKVILGHLKRQQPGRVISVTLTRYRSAAAYRMKVESKDGMISTVILDARTGRLLASTGS